MTFALFTYQGTHNLGDAIQSIALSRLLPAPCAGVDRTTGTGAAEGAQLVANGWLGNNQAPESPDPGTLFAGVFVAQPHNYDWIKESSHPVGARDPATLDQLGKRNIRSEFVGCATLTFDRYDGKRTGTYAVDFDGPHPPRAVRLTHGIPADLPWAEQWARGLHFLELYRTAEVVYTTRLHVALPCLALGTPVFIPALQNPRFPDSATAERFSILNELGVKFGRTNEIDVSTAAERYIQFLRRTLGVDGTKRAPAMPAAPRLSSYESSTSPTIGRKRRRDCASTVPPHAMPEPQTTRKQTTTIHSTMNQTDWRIEQIALAMMTVERNPQYVFQTLASLFIADPLAAGLSNVSLLVDSDSADYLGNLRHLGRCEILPMHPEQWGAVKDFEVHRRACHNFARALRAMPADARGVLVCEDDVVFRDGAIEKLLQALTEMNGSGLTDFVLAGYSPHDHDADHSLRRGSFYSSYFASAFFGSQCLFFPRAQALAVADLVEEDGVRNPKRPYDLLVNGYCSTHQNLYATRHSLVQHIGRVTTGLGYWHESPSFNRRWPVEEGGSAI